MPRIFEVFGYRIDDTSPAALSGRQQAKCPFMGAQCDGGGNRFLSHIHVRQRSPLSKAFPGLKVVPSAVCSLQLHPNERPWIVCPRRLLALRRETSATTRYQRFAEKTLLEQGGFAHATRVGVWPEVKVKFRQGTGTDAEKLFDYTFDYILVPLGRASAPEIERMVGTSWGDLRPVLEQSGYTLAHRKNTQWVDDFPVGPPMVVEIMTSSTSGGNERKRTTIPLCFEDAILGLNHTSPGINYRQVWARMVSQLIVKSEVAIAWGGRAFWIVQDTLVDYISSSTALDIRTFLADHPSEVNMLSLSYGDAYKTQKSGVIELGEGCLYAGPIGPTRAQSSQRYFQDMVRAPMCPPLSTLLSLLARRTPASTIVVNTGDQGSGQGR